MSVSLEDKYARNAKTKTKLESGEKDHGGIDPKVRTTTHASVIRSVIVTVAAIVLVPKTETVYVHIPAQVAMN